MKKIKRKIDKRFSHRRLWCAECSNKFKTKTITDHYKVPGENIWECNECGNLRSVDGITPSTFELSK